MKSQAAVMFTAEEAKFINRVLIARRNEMEDKSESSNPTGIAKRTHCLENADKCRKLINKICEAFGV